MNTSCLSTGPDPVSRSCDTASCISSAFQPSLPRRLRRALLCLALLLPLGAWAQLQFLQDAEPQRVFGGDERKLAVTIYNPGPNPAEVDVHTRLYVANSTKAVPLNDTFWKHLQVLPGQTVNDSVSLRFPAVKAETRYWLQWTDGGTRILHVMEVYVHPPDLLKELKALVGSEAVGLYDPLSHFKPVLKDAGVDFEDLEKGSFEDFHGKLVICGPFASKQRMRGDLPGRIKAWAEAGVAVVWIVPPPEKRQELQPSFYTVQQGKAAVVVAQPALVANLADSPATQLHLLRLVRLALHPESPKLPYVSP